MFLRKTLFFSKNLSSFDVNNIYFNLIYLIDMKIEYNNLYISLMWLF